MRRRAYGASERRHQEVVRAGEAAARWRRDSRKRQRVLPWRLVVGDYVWIGEDARIVSLAKATIGSHVCISQLAYLCTGSHDYLRDDFKLVTAPITLANETLDAAAAFAGPGVTVGGSIVAPGSVVLRDVPSGTLVKRNPAVVTTRDAERPES